MAVLVGADAHVLGLFAIRAELSQMIPSLSRYRVLQLSWRRLGGWGDRAGLVAVLDGPLQLLGENGERVIHGMFG